MFGTTNYQVMKKIHDILSHFDAVHQCDRRTELPYTVFACSALSSKTGTGLHVNGQFKFTAVNYKQWSPFYPNVTTLRSGLCYRNSVCRLSAVCNVGAPYSEGWSFRQYFFTAVYAGHPLTSVQNFTEIVQGEPLRRER